jgi:hypothetical protein
MNWEYVLLKGFDLALGYFSREEMMAKIAEWKAAGKDWESVNAELDKLLDEGEARIRAKALAKAASGE